MVVALVRRRSPTGAREGAAANFRELNDVELAELARDSEERLIAYIAEARRVGRDDAAIRAAQILAFRYQERIRGFVLGQVRKRGAAVADEIAERAIGDAIASVESFAGSSIGEFRSWIFTIARRRIIDYLRRGRVREEPLEIDWGEGERERKEMGTADPLEAVDRGSIFNQAFSELNHSHKLVICLVRFYDLPHRKVAEQVNRHFGDQLNDPMTEQNVNQINSRFDKRLDKLLGEADDPPPVDDDG
jgi:RNA polymerase sigma factor (sigma-70 family)